MHADVAAARLTACMEDTGKGRHRKLVMAATKTKQRPSRERCNIDRKWLGRKNLVTGEGNVLRARVQGKEMRRDMHVWRKAGQNHTCSVVGVKHPHICARSGSGEVRWWQRRLAGTWPHTKPGCPTDRHLSPHSNGKGTGAGNVLWPHSEDAGTGDCAAE